MGALYKRGTRYWIKYYVNGRPVRESTGTDDKEQAKRMLKGREGAVAIGAPVPPRLDKILYDELAEDLRTFYQTTGKRRLAEVDDRLTYINKFFRGRRAASIGPALVTEYAARRQEDKTRFKTVPSNRTINIELSILKLMLRLAYKNGKLLRVPPIDLLREAPPREGFFEAHQYEAVRRRLPDDLRAARRHRSHLRLAKVGDPLTWAAPTRPQGRNVAPRSRNHEERGGAYRVPHSGAQRAAGRPGRACGGSTAQLGVFP
jgi:hypothetical protein